MGRKSASRRAPLTFRRIAVTCRRGNPEQLRNGLVFQAILPNTAVMQNVTRPVRHYGTNCGTKILRAPRAFGRALIKVYRYTFSPLIGFHCRHMPTCSEYGDEAIARHGLWAGGWMTLARLCRCHPYGTSGLDFVPEHKPEHAHWYLPWRYARWRGTNETPPSPAP
jgi:putative membrane protein insertion efficiency factor